MSSKILFSLLALVTFLTFNSCKKFERDNPLDGKKTTTNGGSNTSGKEELTFISYNVACKYDAGDVNYNTDQTIRKGDRVFLGIKVKNSGSTTIIGAKATVSSSSNLITITPLTSGYFIKLTEGSMTSNTINASGIGYAVITDGHYLRTADNYDTYAIEFKVSNSATVGSSIPFDITMTDDAGNSWSDSFTITIQ